MFICLLALPVLGAVVWVVTRSKMNLETGTSTPEEELLRTGSKIKARLVAHRTVSLEESGETTTFEQSGQTSVWLTDAKGPIYDTIVITVQPLDDDDEM